MIYEPISRRKARSTVGRDNYHVKRQKKKYSCGAAAVRNAMRFYGKKVAEHIVRGVCGTVEDGTDHHGMMRALKKFNYPYTEHKSTDFFESYRWLHAELRKGHPVILCTQNWEHWVLAIGSCGPMGVVVFDSSRFKNNTEENGVHIWSYSDLQHEWINTRVHVDIEEDDIFHRIYAISTHPIPVSLKNT